MSQGSWASLIPLLLIVLAFWLLVLRPARLRQRQTNTLQRQLAVGNVVMLSSGVFGEVTALGEESIQLRVAPEVQITVHRHAVGRLLSEQDAAKLREDGTLGWAANPTPNAETTQSSPPANPPMNPPA